jgi:hypothetical protein
MIPNCERPGLLEEIADSRVGARKVKGQPGASCTSKQGSAQRIKRLWQKTQSYLLSPNFRHLEHRKELTIRDYNIEFFKTP